MCLIYCHLVFAVSTESLEDDNATLCLEDRLKSAGVLCDGDALSSYKPKTSSSLTPDAGNEPHILVGMDLPAKKVCFFLEQ